MLAYFCCQNGNAIAEPTEEGLRRLGYTVQRVIPWNWTDTMFVKGTSLLVCTGLRRQQRVMRDAHVARGVPWISFDLPFVRGVEGDSRLFIRDHTWLPDVTGLPSRLERLGLTLSGPAAPAEAVIEPVSEPVKKARGKKKATKPKAVKAAEPDGYALVIGQVPRDSSHNLTEGELQKWAAGVFDAIRAEMPGVEVVWRPHPKTGGSWHYEPPGYDRKHDSHKEPLSDALAGARVVCTIGSTVGLEALIAGKPVVAWGSSCYRELCASPKELATATHPGVEAVTELLERVAYTQWGLEELATGEPFLFIFKQAGIPCTVTLNV